MEVTDKTDKTDMTMGKGKASMTIGKASRILGVSTGTLRRWEITGQITPIRTPSGHRRYSRAQIDSLVTEMGGSGSGPGDKSVSVLVVSGDNQIGCLNNYCKANGYDSTVVIRVNSDSDEHEKESVRLAELLMKGQARRIVVCTMIDVRKIEHFILSLAKAAKVEILITNSEASN